MSDIPLMPLVVAKDIEPLRSWEGFDTPHDLALYLARMFAVDSSQITRLQEFVVNSVEPVGVDREKIWIKSEGVPAIGLPIGGTYQMIYKYPPNIPLLWTGGDLPPYLRKLSDNELTNYGLANPDNTNYYYFILEV